MRLPQSIPSSISVFTLNFFVAIGIFIAALGQPALGFGQTAPQLASSPTNLRFGTVNLGQTETQLITLTNAGQSSLTITGIVSNNAEFTTSGVSLPVVLQTGQSVDLSVIFTPTVVAWTGGTIQFSNTGTTPNFVIGVAGTGVSTQPLTANPPVLSFGNVALGAKATLPVVLTNPRSSAITLSQLQSADAEFSVTGPSFPMNLNPGQSITLDVTFTPLSAGTVGGSIFVTGPRLNIPLTGTGTSAVAGQLTIAPSPLNFGNVAIGSTATQSMAMTASGASVTVYSGSSSNSQFALDGATFPFTVAAGQTISFNVAFTPQNSGTDSASLSFTSNASNSKAVESLSGVGTVASYSVNLSWNAAADVMGYNVYRSTAPTGTYSKINSSLDANTAYTDSSVASGSTYYYEATSVNTNGIESAKSTPPVTAVVP